MLTNKKDTWSDNIYTHAVIWRNWALVMALFSLFIAGISLVILVKLLPLKENTPFLVFVDQEFGEPRSIRPVAANEFVENDQLKKYMIRKFVIARERYNPNTLSEDAQIVATLSNDIVYQDYRHNLSMNNHDHIVDVSKINISFLNSQRAYITFMLHVENQGLINELPVSAQIKFHFAQKDIPVDVADMINPVNFEVLSYQSHYQVNFEGAL